jgi:myo-inositol-1(or 4)-monophosphatase
MDDDLLSLLHDTADAVRSALSRVADWTITTERSGQYALDLVADEAALGVLDRAGLGVLSEESGLHRPDHPLVVVIDPVDGSTNASRRIPWYATSMCVLDADGPRVAMVVNQANGERFHAVRGSGAYRDDARLHPTACIQLSQALVLLNGFPPRPLGWDQYRVLGASALDLCAVAAGWADGFVDCGKALDPWDFLGGLLVCQEAGAVAVDIGGQPLADRAHISRRTVVAAATPALLTSLVEARASF